MASETYNGPIFHHEHVLEYWKEENRKLLAEHLVFLQQCNTNPQLLEHQREWDMWEQFDELKAERLNVESWQVHSKQSKDEQKLELERIDAAIADLIGDKPSQTPATPAPVVAVKPASDGPAPVTPATAWSLITSLARIPGYRWPLHQFLQAEHVAGKSCPKAQDVLNVWKLKPPPGLRVIQSGRHDELEFELSHGGKKTADLRAIQTAINGLVV